MFIFLESTFCTEIDDNVLTQNDLTIIKNIRELYSELSNWSSAAIYFAWGQYSQDIYAVQWVDFVKDRELGFLAYCYICQIRPSFNFGGTGLYDSEIWNLGEERPWEQKQPVDLPDCFM